MILQCNAAEYADPEVFEDWAQAKTKKTNNTAATSKQDVFNQIPDLLKRPVQAAFSAQNFTNNGVVAALSLMQQNIDTILFGEHDDKSNGINSNILGEFDRLVRRNDTESVNQFDTDTVDVIRMMFDIIFEDNRLTHELKIELAKLQIPLLKVAVMDDNYFGNDPHPADQLVNKLTDAALELGKKGNMNSDSFIDEVSFIVDRVIKEFTDDPAVFNDIMNSSSLFSKKEPVKAAKSIQSLKETTEKLKNLSARAKNIKPAATVNTVKISEKTSAKTVTKKTNPVNRKATPLAKTKKTKTPKQLIANAIRTKVLQYKLPTEVREFMNTTWVEVATCIYDTHGDKSATWKSAMLVVDELTWVFQKKTGGQDKIRLSDIIPHLITNIQDGLISTDCTSHHKAKIFSTLLSIHAANLKDQRFNNIA